MDSNHNIPERIESIGFMDQDNDVFNISDDLMPQKDPGIAERKMLNTIKYSAKYSNCFANQFTEEERYAQYKACIKEKRSKRKEKIKASKKEDANHQSSKAGWRKIVESKQALRAFYRNRLEEYKQTGCKIVIDLSFSNVMVDKEIRSLAYQLSFCINAIKKSEFPVHLNLCSYKDKIKAECELLSFKKCNISVFEDAIEDVFHGDIQRVVYLSPDADDVLDSFTPDDIYVIGGLVDNKILKNETRERAKDIKIVSKRLPLEFVDNIKKYRSCLNINTVIEIIVAYFKLNDIKMAIKEALPLKYFKKTA